MSIIINDKRLVPAPFVNFSKTYNLTGDGRKLSPTFQLTLNGTILAAKGSPFSNGTWYSGVAYPSDETITGNDDRFNSILAKQEAIRELFTQPGSLMRYGPPTGLSPVSGYFRAVSINFEPGTWVDQCKYSIVLETELLNKVNSEKSEDYLGDFADLFLTQASEQYSISQDENADTFTVTHNISAVGKAAYSGISTLYNANAEPWQNAKTWVVGRAANGISSSLINTTGRSKFNKRSTENIDVVGGSYGLKDTYIYSSGDASYTHLYDINRAVTRSQVNDLNDGQLLTENITINGTVQGLYPSGYSPSGRLAAARSFFNSIENQIPTYAGLGTGFLFVSKNVAENQTNGTIQYSLNYTNYPNANPYTHTYSIIHNAISNGPSTASINGTIQGLTNSGVANGFGIATGLWTNTVRGSLASVIAGVIGSGLVAQPSTVAVGFDRSENRVTYNANFNVVEQENGSSADYLDTWETSFSDTRGRTYGDFSPSATVTINGQIIGYAMNGSAKDRYNSASTRWNAIKGTLKNRFAPTLSSASVSDRIISRTETHNKINGIITYSQTHSLRTDISKDGIISEDVNISTQLPKDVFAVQIIPGKSDGPIIQNIGTTTEARKTLTVNFVLEPTGNKSSAIERFNELEAVYAPTGIKYVDNHSEDYNPIVGNYTRTKTWAYRTDSI